MKQLRLVNAALTVVFTATIALGTAGPAQAASTTARSLLGGVASAAEKNTGYDRSLFQGWIDADKDCQDTRQEVLVKESTLTPTYTTSSACRVATGRWVSRWDGAVWTSPSDVDVDHHVPLGEAWGSGASSWTSGDRGRLANDLYGPALNAMTDSLNASKGDGDPAEWLPPKISNRCTYAIWWVQVKYRWRMTIDSAERTALSSILSGTCGERVVTIPGRAR